MKGLMLADSLTRIAGALALVVLNGFFVAAEFALVKVRVTRIEELARQGSSAAKLARKEIGRLDAYLSACQLGVTLASLGLGWLGEPAFSDLVRPATDWISQFAPVSPHAVAAAVAFCVITFLHIVFGELAPKTLSIVRTEGTALWVAYPLYWFYRLFYLPIVALNGSANFFLRALGLTPSPEHALAHTEEEVRIILNASTRSGALEEREVDMVEHVFDFGDTSVHRVMVPRVDIAYLSEEWPMSKVLEVTKEYAHTRYILVEEEDLDRVTGFVHLKDLLHLSQRRSASLTEIRRDLLMVPESQQIDRLLRAFQQSRVQIALVLDEYGGTAGMVTLQDLVEEIVGEVPDEFQTEEPRIQQGPDGTLLMAGTALLSDLTERLGVEFEEPEFDTVGGYVMGELGRLPEEGDEVRVGSCRLRVTEMQGQRIARIEASTSEAPAQLTDSEEAP